MEFNYQKLMPFKWFVLQNFPFIEEDFDAITNYQMFCKLGEEINKLIDSQNLTGEQIENLTNAYNALHDYVENYFENLDVQEEINNKLDEMTESGELTNIIKNYIDPFIIAQNTSIANKFNQQDTLINNSLNAQNTLINQNKQDTDNLIAQQNTIIQSLVNNNPIPVTSTSDMTDTSKIYVLTTNGYWYYYNGSAWTQGGLYQTAENSDAVTDLQSYFTKTENLFEYKKAKDGYYINQNNGNEVANAGFIASPFIEILPSTNYTFGTFQHVVWYNASKQYISNTATNTATSPSNAKYVRFDINKSSLISNSLPLENVMLVQGNYLPLDPIPPVIPSYKIPANKTNGIVERTLNLFNYKALKDGYYINQNNGNETSNASFACSDFIEVGVGLTYVLSTFQHIVWYNASKQYISKSTDYPAVAPANAKYMRFDINKSSMEHSGLTFDTLMVIQGNSLPSNFIPYLTPVNKIPKSKISDLNEIVNDWESKNILLYGDSIVAQCNPDSPSGSWGNLIKNYFKFSNAYGRGVGGQKFVWNDGTFQVNSDGEYVDRGTASDNCLGCFCSWQRISSMIPSSIRNNIDIIIINGGTNDLHQESPIGNINYNSSQNSDTDWASDTTYRQFTGDYDVTTYKGAIASTIMKMQALCPNAVIVLASQLSGDGNNNGSNQTNFYENDIHLTAIDYVNAMKEVAEQFSIPYIDIFETSGINQLNRNTYISDGVHPNTDGQKMLARAVIGGLKNIIPMYE